MDLLVIGALLAVALLVVFGVRWWTWRPLLKRRALVQTDEVAFDAVVVSRRGPLLVLADVTARMSGGEQHIDGMVVVERSKVQFMQVM